MADKPLTLTDKEIAERRRQRFAFLDRRIPELHRSGNFPGRLARTQADREWAESIKTQET